MKQETFIVKQEQEEEVVTFEKMNSDEHEWGSACLSTSAFHWAPQHRHSPPLHAGSWGRAEGGGSDDGASDPELLQD